MNRNARRVIAAILVSALVIGACSSADDDSARTTADGASVASTEGLQEAMDVEGYEHARWGMVVEPAGGGEAVRSLNESQVFAMGSNTKLFSVGAYLDALGPEHTITTPVHSEGDDLVLVGMGDLVLGGHDAGSAELGYSVPPQADANGLPGAKPAPGDPLAGLDSLAEQVVESGITEVPGDVVVDDRLFELWDTEGGPISPITVNDNLLAVQVKPTEGGSPAELTVIPDTSAFTIENQTTTVDSDGDMTISLDPAQTDAEGVPVGTSLVLSGDVPKGADPVLNVFQVPDPASFARILFIEALERAGVDVAASPEGTNDPTGLPDDYSADPVATVTSPKSTQIATLIWKISHNYGANLLTCLLAVEAGSTDCEDGLITIHEKAGDLGIGVDELWLVNGAGSDYSSTTPSAIVRWIEWMRGTDWGGSLSEMLPIMGVDGSLGLSQTDTPSTGRIQAKTGTWAGVDMGSGALLLPGIGLAGLMQDAEGDEYVFSMYMNGATLEGNPGEQVKNATFAMSAAAASVQQSLRSN